MLDPRMPSDEAIYTRTGDFVVFNQLAVKIEMDAVSNDAYFRWLDDITGDIGKLVPGAEIREKENARTSPPLNTAVYYDTLDYRILPTGALLRTSCNRITHAFCAFKAAEDAHKVRSDHRYVFAGEDKRTIQMAPTSPEAVTIVKRLLARRDIEHPGIHLEKHYGIRGEDLEPAVRLDDYRYTFFAWIDKKDALRCSIDRAHVTNLRLPQDQQESKPVSEVEIAIYPRIDPAVARDPRVVDLVRALSMSLCQRFGVPVTTDIKYQRAARVLGIGGFAER